MCVCTTENTTATTATTFSGDPPRATRKQTKTKIATPTRISVKAMSVGSKSINRHQTHIDDAELSSQKTKTIKTLLSNIGKKKTQMGVSRAWKRNSSGNSPSAGLSTLSTII